MDRRSELAALVEGLDTNRYYDAWVLALIVWRSLWQNSSVDWGRYRTRIWDMYSERLRVAARTSASVSGFIERCAQLFSLAQVGNNESEREEVLRLVALPEREQSNVMDRLREDTVLIAALVRRWRDVIGKQDREEEA